MSKFKSSIALKTVSKIGLILFFASLFAVACKKPSTDFPDVPQIEYVGFETKGDSATLTISFQDGNGDIGVEEDDLSVDFNMFIGYFEKDDTEGWVQQLDGLGDPIFFRYRIPILEPNGTDKSLEGEIDVLMEPTYFHPISPDNDTLRYEIYLVDRAENISNVITTPEFHR